MHPSEPVYWDWPAGPSAGPPRPLPCPGEPVAKIPPAWTSEPWSIPSHGVYGRRYRHPNGTIVTCSEGPLGSGIAVRVRHVGVSLAANDAATDAAAKLFLLPHRHITSPRGFGPVRHYHQTTPPPFADGSWCGSAAESEAHELLAAALGTAMAKLRAKGDL